MKYLLGFIGALVLIGFIVLTILGLVPLASSILGMGPKDLGIRYTVDDSKTARDKSGTQIVSLPADTKPSEDFKLVGKKNAEFTMDSKELTAHSNNRPWKNYPVKNLQIKIHADGTIESSAILIISKAMPYAVGLGYSETQVREAMDKYHIPPFEVPIYILGKGSVTNDNVSVNAQTVKIGVVPIPAGIVSQANTEAASVLNDLIRKHSDAFHAQEVSFADGKMTFKGQVPAQEFVITQ